MNSPTLHPRSPIALYGAAARVALAGVALERGRAPERLQGMSYGARRGDQGHESDRGVAFDHPHFYSGAGS